MVVCGDVILFSFFPFFRICEEAVGNGFRAAPKIDFRDEKMRECTCNLRQMISSDTEAEIVR